jgi:hypothetical protein
MIPYEMNILSFNTYLLSLGEMVYKCRVSGTSIATSFCSYVTSHGESTEIL